MRPNTRRRARGRARPPPGDEAAAAWCGDVCVRGSQRTCGDGRGSVLAGGRGGAATEGGAPSLGRRHDPAGGTATPATALAALAGGQPAWADGSHPHTAHSAGQPPAVTWAAEGARAALWRLARGEKKRTPGGRAF